MKEQFRDKKFRGNIKVSFTDADGNKAVWEKSQTELRDEILDIIMDYTEQDIKLTSRQLYYQLVAADIIPNAQEVYKRVCTFLVDLRYNGLVDWDAIEDRGRVPSKPSDWKNIRELIRTALYAYRLPRWQDQSFYVELFCEKQAMEGVLKPIADKYHIYFGANKGYSSASAMYDLAKRIEAQVIDGNKKAVILYLGDHDPSGLDMVRDIQTRVCEFLRLEKDYAEELFEVIPLALNREQIDAYNPPPNPAKITDPRAKWYLAKHGNVSWELDALEPKVLMGIAEQGILNYLDVEKYQRWVDREKSEGAALRKFGQSL